MAKNGPMQLDMINVYKVDTINKSDSFEGISTATAGPDIIPPIDLELDYTLTHIPLLMVISRLL